IRLPVVVLLAVSVRPLSAQPLELIPADAGAALAIRNLDELIKKGDRFIADTDWKLPIRPSELFREVYQFLGVQGGVDDKGSGAILLLAPDKGKDVGLGNLDELLVGVLPFDDLDKLSASFGFKPGQLKQGEILPGKARDFGKFFMVRGKHLYLAEKERPLKR